MEPAGRGRNSRTSGVSSRGSRRQIRMATPASPTSKMTENESVRPSYGRGVGFYLGEPCNATCNAILTHIYCNKTTSRCECMEEYPVILDNKQCVQAIKLSDPCEHSASCVFYEPNSICPEQDKRCRCQNGYRIKVDAAGEGSCSPVQTTGFIDNSDLTTMISVIGGLMIFTALFCLVLRLFSRARFNRPRDRLATASGTVSVVLEGMDGKPGSTGSSRRASRSSAASNDLYPGSRRPSLSILAPPPSRPGTNSGRYARQGDDSNDEPSQVMQDH